MWICMNPPKARNHTITGYSLTEQQYVGKVKEKEEYYDLMHAVMICLGGSEKEEENELLRLLDVLVSSDKKADEKKAILENEFQIPMTENLEEEVETMCNLSDGVEQKGIQKGIEKKTYTVVLNMLKANESIEKICRYTGCDEAFVKRVQKEIE